MVELTKEEAIELIELTAKELRTRADFLTSGNISHGVFSIKCAAVVILDAINVLKDKE